MKFSELRRSPYLFDLAWLSLLAAVGVWLRWPALSTEGFHNEDVAGITYNADLVRRGLLPLVDFFELKAPGSFFLSAAIWEVAGRSLVSLQRFMCGWALIAAAGVYAGGVLLYGRRAGAVAGLIYAVWSPITDSIDINYGAWMSAPYVWATVFFIAGARSGRARWWVAAGASLAVAGLMKRQGAALFPVFALLALAGPRLALPEGWRTPPPLRGLLAGAGGLALGFAPILLWYLAHGGLGEFVRHYFFSEGGWRYVQGELGWDEKLPRLGDGFLGFAEYMAVPTLLAAFSLVGVHRRGAGLSWRGVLLGSHFWFSFLGAALGFRFFKGYYLQILPAAAWIAAHPDGPVCRWLGREAWPSPWTRRLGQALIGLCLVGALVPAVIKDSGQMTIIRKMRRAPLDLEAQKVARYLVKHTTPEDRLWVWGRWAWPVYFHADRLSTSHYYKVLGIITTNLTNTWRRPTAKTKFVDRGPWREIIAELEAAPPPFIVVSRNEDYRDFKAFVALLAREYQPERALKSRNFTVYRRKPPPKEKARWPVKAPVKAPVAEPESSPGAEPATPPPAPPE